MNYERVLVSLGDRGIYLKLLRRLRDSCVEYNVPHIFWKKLPESSRSHSESPYGFKLHCIQDAIKRGFKTIIWADSACYAIKNPTKLFELVEELDILFLSGTDNLAHYVNDRSLNSLGITRQQINGQPLVSGSLFGFNFNSPKVIEFFDELLSYEKHNYFVEDNQKPDDLFKTHRHDEAIISLMLYKYNIYARNAYQYFQGDGKDVMFKAGKDV